MPTHLPSGLYEDLMTLGWSEAVAAARANGRPIQTRTLPAAGDAAMVAQWLKSQMEGSRPMGIDFELRVPMPAKDFQAWASIVAA